MTQLLLVNNLTKVYGNHKVADSISFELEQGTITALIGPNGAGKTTTLSMLAGLVTPSDGSILFQNQPKADIRASIGFLPQYPKFFPWLTALEFTEMAARLSGIEAKKALEDAKKTLEFVGLGNAMKKRTGTFSGGMKQRLGLAQAIVHKPKLLLLDEPVSALDPVGRRQVMNLLKELQQETTILYSTHILNDAEEMTDQLLFLRKGALVENGSLDSVREKYANPRILIEFESDEEVDRFITMSPWAFSREKRLLVIDAEKEKVRISDALTLLTTENFLIRKLELQTASLEEIFMKVVMEE
ncbi:ABC transporter ATP-binding protein [Sporosarcina highlanderae]|uniref:ABC transporter ATP-binding protein n=1 Tax=Sporosarcina highlanderae TaxID=3035916 RepID=A0ABT8JM99_9BACL|nr:ABC transporter ATP-binding protein [Sporosarcina highlanderae]MDN4606279.1 ABC transporter ATP-binding protein [Sporosarcina highlanderae]